jgi:fatty-acyl-CoA synthase
MLDRSARSDFGNQIAMTYEDETHSFGSLRDRSAQVANGLRSLGIRPGDRVAVLMGHGMAWPEVFFGLAALGAVCVPINVLLTGREITHICLDSGTTAMIVDSLGEPRLAAIDPYPDLTITVGDVAITDARKVVAYEAMIGSVDSKLEPGFGPVLGDTFALYYGSGTTGLPKAAMLTHNAILWNALGQTVDLKLTRDIVYLVVPSLSWAAGFHNLLLALLWVGGRSVLMPTGGTTPERIMDAIERHAVSHVMLVPSLIREFAHDPALLSRLRDSTLRWIVTGAEPVPLALLEVMNHELPDCRVCQGYGLSEFPTICTLLSPDEALEHNGAAGRPLSHAQVAIQTSEGSILDSGDGELLIRSLATMSGYYNRPELNDEVFAGGWLHTGDLASIDEGGYVTIIGRTKDMIISGGLNVYPKEVEDVLGLVPGISEVAVVGVPHEKFGEQPVAVVVANGADTVSVDYLNELCRTHLASYKRPSAVLFWEGPLPRNPTGKLLKRQLRPWAASQLGLDPDLS